MHPTMPQQAMQPAATTQNLETTPTTLGRVFTLLYGSASYAVCLVTFIYLMGFIVNFGVPKSMDSAAAGPLSTALMIDLGLLALFALQHSVMARAGFKRVITRIIPPVIERSTYVLVSSVALLFLFWKWRPLGGPVWDVHNSTGRAVLYGAYVFGWLLLFTATFVINHFDLFGLSQVWRNLRGRPQQKLKFVTPFLYRIVRHPLYVGWLLIFWSAPTMTASHLFFAVVTTAYILIAIQIEERDLIREHPEYAEYRQRVPMLIPGTGNPQAPARSAIVN